MDVRLVKDGIGRLFVRRPVVTSTAFSLVDPAHPIVTSEGASVSLPISCSSDNSGTFEGTLLLRALPPEGRQVVPLSCEVVAPIPLPMVVDDFFTGRSGFGSEGTPLHSEDDLCPFRAGSERGDCHRFIWDGTGGIFTGTISTDGFGFTDLNALLVEPGLGPEGVPVHIEDDLCPTRPGGENGECHRFTWDGAGVFTGTFWTDGDGFDIRPKRVESGATAVSFYAWGAVGGEIITFGAGIEGPDFDGVTSTADLTLLRHPPSTRSTSWSWPTSTRSSVPSSGPGTTTRIRVDSPSSWMTSSGRSEESDPTPRN